MDLRFALACHLVISLSLFSCNSGHDSKTANAASPAPAALASLVGSEWVLTDVAGTPALEKPPATLLFPEAGRTAGSGSCNRFTGGVEISGNTIKFGALASTRMACMDAGVNAQEARYLKALQGATRYSLENGNLLIYCEGYEKPLRFSPAPAVKP